MSTTTKKVLIDRIAAQTKQNRAAVKAILQSFLACVIEEIGRGNRIEFRDFGSFVIKHRASRVAQNPKTMEPIPVPPRRAVKFRAGRLMREALERRAVAGRDLVATSIETFSRSGERVGSERAG